MGDSISAFMSVYKNQRAVFEALKSFRAHYPREQITVASDAGDDFTKICETFNARFIRYDTRTVTGPADQPGNTRNTLAGTYEMLDRLYEHCISTEAKWVVDLETDVRTIRRIRTFPPTECAGPRLNPFSPALTERLTREFGYKEYGYGMAGGSIWKRDVYIQAYENNRNIGEYVADDDRVATCGDVALTLLFLMNGFNYSVWADVSEIFHEVAPIIRDAAFDHAYKYWYGKEFNDKMLEDYLDELCR